MRRAILATGFLAALAAAGALYVFETSPTWYERLRYPLRYGEIVRAEARAKRIDPALLAAVIYQESKFERDARSGSGAIGLMQLTPETAMGIAIRTGGTAFRVTDLTDPSVNIRYGAWYLRHLFSKYGSERLALAAYNAGQGNVDRWLRDGRQIEFPETRAYITHVSRLKEIYREAWREELYPPG